MSDTRVEAPRAESPPAGSFSLARPWKFPAAPPDVAFCRRHERTRVNIPAEITLRRPDGSSYDEGSGVILDLSSSGLLLGDVFLAHGRILSGCFTIHLRALGREIPGRVLRAFSRGVPGFGIEFLPREPGEERLHWTST